MTSEKTSEKIETSPEKPLSLTAAMSKKAVFLHFRMWLVGDTPLITHAWSEKARREMLSKQVKATKQGREVRDPEEEYRSSLYEMGDGNYGIPVTGAKAAIVGAAHKDKGVPRTALQAALYLDANMVRTRPALAGAICDLPLVKIWGSAPEMREDMVRIGSGIKKTATLSYRGQFTTWAILITGRLNESVVPQEAFITLVADAGVSIGLGEWRNERSGIFGAFHMASPEEESEWDAFAAGGPLPGQLLEAAE
jgi:hypothetical protein